MAKTVIWTFIPSNIAGRTKKTVISTVVFVAYCVGNAIGAQMMRASDAPKYVRGITACAVLYVLEVALMGCWRFYCMCLSNPASEVWTSADPPCQMSGRTAAAPG